MIGGPGPGWVQGRGGPGWDCGVFSHVIYRKSTPPPRPAPSGPCEAGLPGKGPAGRAERPGQGDIGSLRKTTTARGGGRTLPSYITLPPSQEEKTSPPQRKEKPVGPPLLGALSRLHNRH